MKARDIHEYHHQYISIQSLTSIPPAMKSSKLSLREDEYLAPSSHIDTRTNTHRCAQRERDRETETQRESAIVDDLECSSDRCFIVTTMASTYPDLLRGKVCNPCKSSPSYLDCHYCSSCLLNHITSIHLPLLLLLLRSSFCTF